MNEKLKKETGDILLFAEADEQWSYVQNKKQQRWLWYALDKLSGKIIAYVFGRRTDKTFKRLLKKLEDLASNIGLPMIGEVISGFYLLKSTRLANGILKQSSAVI